MIVKMTERYAKEIITWSYQKPYDVYNMTEAYEELMASYLAVVDEELIGFCCSGEDAQVPPGRYDRGYLDFGVGMKPSLCGKGFGRHFMQEIMTHYKKPLRLTVLAWNKRAISLYDQLGFEETERFYRGERQFIIMRLS